jgi:hypothetical protein
MPPETNVVGHLPLSATWARSTALEHSRVLKAGAGNLLALYGYNSSASAQFIQLHNATSVPSDTAVPFISWKVAAGDNFYIYLPVGGLPFDTGITVCNSSTAPTKSIGSADCLFYALVSNLV